MSKRFRKTRQGAFAVELLEERRLLSRLVGIDVSEYQGNINWTSVKNAGKSFAFIRASTGQNTVDAKFTTNATNAAAAGVLAGYYHYAYYDLAGHTPTAEADHFWNTIKNYISADGKHLMPVLDVEQAADPSNGQTLSQWVNAWVARVVSNAANAVVPLSVTPLVYCNVSDSARLASSGVDSVTLHTPHWVAQWPVSLPDPQTAQPTSNSPWLQSLSPFSYSAWSFWQYSATGTVSGISGNVDLDVLQGDANVIKDFVVGSTGRWTDGTRVQANVSLSVWNTSDSNGTLIGTEASGGKGTIVSGPVYGTSFMRWQVNFDDGKNGWVAEYQSVQPASPFTAIDWLTTVTPAVATNPNPANGAAVSSLPANFTWTAGANATSYSVYVDNVFKATVGSPTWAHTSIATGAHTWRVDSINGELTTTGTTWSFTLQSIAGTPSVPDLNSGSDGGASSTDNITNDNTPQFDGTADPSSTVKIYSDGVLVGTGTATVGGTYAIVVSTLADGAHNITATATNGFGTSAASSPLAITVDTAAPGTPPTPDMNAASDMGSSNTDNVTNDDTPQFDGTAEAGSTVTIYSDGVSVGSGTATGGNYSITTSAIAAGTHSITAIASDLAGNVSGTSGALSVTIDKTAPLAPSVPDLDPASDLGTSSTDNLTSTTTLVFIGTADANATVKIFINSVLAGSGQASAGGVYSVTATGVVGANTVTASQTDLAGNAGPTSTSLSVQVDLTPPATPAAPDLTAGTDSGTSNTDNITKNTTPTFFGSTATGAVVRLYSDGVLVGTGTAGGGIYSINSSALAPGQHSMTVTASDTAGNTTPQSAALVVTIDNSIAVPSVPDLSAGSDSGASNSDDTTNVTTPVFSGTAEDGATVRVYVDGVIKGSGVAAGGSYAIAVSALTPGAHNVTADASDVAGNLSAVSSALPIVIDTLASAPSTPDLVAGDDSGASSIDNLTSVTTPTFTGTAEAGATVRIYSDGVQLGSGVASGGVYTIGVTSLVDGVHSITADATDVAGNLSALSGTLSVTIDTSIATPGAPDLAAASDSGASSIDNYTSVTTPTFTGTAEAGATVRIYSDGVQVGSGVASGGVYSIGVTSLVDGVHSITADATDAAGNVSAVSGGLAITIDTAIATPGAPDLAAASDSGASASDNYTNVTTPTFTGTAEPGASVRIYVDGVLKGSGVASGGAYSIAVTALSPGGHTVTADATDAAGNVSVVSGGLLMTIDTTAPTADIIDITPDPRTGPVSAASIVFSEAVSGVGMGGLSLSRDGGASSLALASLSSGDNLSFDLGNLDLLTARAGSYVLGISVGSIEDLAGNALAGGASDAWANVRITGTAGGEEVRLVRGASAGLVDVFINNVTATPDYTVDAAALGHLELSLLGGADTVVLDFSNGGIAPAGGLLIDVGGGTDSIRVLGASPADAFAFGAAQITHGAEVVSTAGEEALVVESGTFAFGFDVGGRDVSVGAAATAVFNTTQHVGTLAIGAGGRASIAPGGDKVIVAGALELTGNAVLDLVDNGMVVDYSGAPGTLLANLSARIAAARNGYDVNTVTNWDGSGIGSSAARDNSVAAGFDLYSVGIIDNENFGDPNIGRDSYTVFLGQTIDSSSILIRYTNAGDADLNGFVDGDDYALIDNSFNGLIPDFGWLSGNFNYDVLIDGDDYALIDSGYLFQGPPL